ncbi:hypothetical protein EU95_1272 [Prochlorococcus marinus str. MIT 9201]|uniref:Uncharacterized protein n=1 Tax=Prochlorococcus marinus str. MIT 9201 TaxID=93057 RepID=A0A0A2A435_PROMR|nr:hypothetical protein EU95_1272 [Prochlorococcus marinus str. MIT 9201]
MKKHLYFVSKKNSIISKTSNSKSKLINKIFQIKKAPMKGAF